MHVISFFTFYLRYTGKYFYSMVFFESNAEKPGGANIVSLTRRLFMQTAISELDKISCTVYNIQ